jgi:putative ABC transport system substrate-binding protein
MNRRTFLGTLAGSLLTAPITGEAQQASKSWRIGYLSPAEVHGPIDEAFERSLKDLGYVEGQNIRLERRYTAGRPDRIDDIAAELVRLNVDLIVVWSPSLTLAVKNATRTIPIVFLAGGLGVLEGAVASLPRPGSNLTGVTFQAGQENLEPKYLEMLKAVVPNLSRVALLRFAADDGPAQPDEVVERAGRSLGIRLSITRPQRPEDLTAVFAKIKVERPQGLIVTPNGLLYAHRREVIEFAAGTRLPTVYGFRELVQEGGLMSLSPSLSEIAARGGFYVDKILRGAKPADLPVEQPTKFEFVINLKTAKALGLTSPPSLMQRADQVIE